MGKSKVELAVQFERKLARDIAFKWILTPAVALIILVVVLVMVFSQLGLLKLFSGTVTGWTIIGLSIIWFGYASFIQVFVIEPRVFLRQMGLPMGVNLALTLLIVLVGVSVGFSFFSMSKG